MKARTSAKSNKLTLSVRSRYIAMLRRASARRGRSITELVEELAVSLDKEKDEPGELSDFVKRNRGTAAGRLKPADWEKDDMLGHILRKHVPRI
ncbi:MAG TPA: DUF6364 family protein [Flavobacteriales bacterium]|nr:DUF6364 family protein [Flavobacteriales bacterium]HRO40925.1 DUF6364 family protein [Flavobacteriales bacterium]HRP81237.1 DUF6364 family protein [Flavobacteriales bacterium]